MWSDILNVLLALAAFCIPMAFAWFILSRTARRHKHRNGRKDRP